MNPNKTAWCYVSLNHPTGVYCVTSPTGKSVVLTEVPWALLKLFTQALYHPSEKRTDSTLIESSAPILLSYSEMALVLKFAAPTIEVDATHDEDNDLEDREPDFEAEAELRAEREANTREWQTC
jgi:hypothetical protein